MKTTDQWKREKKKESKSKEKETVDVYTPCVTSDKTFTSLIGLTSARKEKEREKRIEEASIKKECPVYITIYFVISLPL